MSHLSARLCMLFAVDVYKHIVHCKNFAKAFVDGLAGIARLSNDIYQCRRQYLVGIPKRIIEQDAPQHIELAAVICFNGMMPAVVYPGSGFIYHYISIN